jgi:hypothetical protein
MESITKTVIKINAQVKIAKTLDNITSATSTNVKIQGA